jgi:hypothetical protein
MDENFRYKTNNFSLHFVLRQIASGRMEVEPDFKDLKARSVRDKSLFVESLILGIPTQPIWCEETPSGDYIVIEGSERLTTLVDFFNEKFSLSSLKIRKEYSELYFSQLPYHEKISLEDRYQFTFIIINYDTLPQLKCEFFRRLLNDTGNSSDQSARNFAWPRSFGYLQEIKESCEHLIDFAPRDSRLRMNFRSKTTKVRSEMDEVFLYLIMIVIILSGDVDEEAYLDDSMSIDDLLDWTMNYIAITGGRRVDAKNRVHRALMQIVQLLGHPPLVLLSNTVRTAYTTRDDLALPEFYFLFVRTFSGHINAEVDWKIVRAQRFVKSSSAKNLITYIFQARNDQFTDHKKH